MPAPRKVFLPPRLIIETYKSRNPIRWWNLGEKFDGVSEAWSRKGTIGELLIGSTHGGTLIVPKRVTAPADTDRVLVVSADKIQNLPHEAEATIDARDGHWASPRLNQQLPTTCADWKLLQEHIRDSWKHGIEFKREQRDDAGQVSVKGLRNPQIGALHAILAHWSVTSAPATIVMPTGTGKTETMLAAMIETRPQRLLVVVPTDALRQQITAKFSLLGVLPDATVLRGAALPPIVGTMRHRPRSTAEVEELFACCNVVVTTMTVAGTCTPEIQQAMASHVSHLVIDEAHHITAATWAYFRTQFLEKNILQFTATPFRRDRKHVDGAVIFSYPLRKAQEEGLFQQVDFKPVVSYGSHSESDRAIAEAAGKQLISDVAAGFDHLAMARAESIARAEQLGQLYETIDGERMDEGDTALGVVVIHSQQTAAERNAAMTALAERNARIVVCVDMFGEGFDLPNLKIAALHDVHKSLAITLGLTRFSGHGFKSTYAAFWSRAS